MSLQTTLPGLFAPEQVDLPIREPEMPTDRQVNYARVLAAQTGKAIPGALLRDRAGLSAWIDRVKPKPPGGQFASYPSSKQVAFAERIARVKRRQIPDECFRDRTMMSRWIDGNKPR